MTTHGGTLLPFADAIRVEAAGPDAYAAELQPSWSSLVGIHGGYTAAVAARAVAVHVDDPTKPLRSALVQFVSRPDPGPATVLVDVERSGRHDARRHPPAPPGRLRCWHAISVAQC